MDKKTLVNLLKLSHVKRWVIIDCIKNQSVADHSFRVQIIAVHLIDKLKLPLDKGKIVLDIMMHDVLEAETGDIPSTYKKANQDFQPSGSIEYCLLRLADTIEANIFLQRYVLRPHRVTRFLDSKILFLQKELSGFCNVPVGEVSEVIDNLIATGRNYD